MAAPAERDGRPYVVGIDLGGTAAKLGLLRCRLEPDEASSSSVDDLLVHSLRVPLPAAVEGRTPEAVLQLLVNGYERLLREDRLNMTGFFVVKVVGVGVGFPGQVRGGIAVGAANLSKTWRNVPLAEQLAERLRVPVVVLVNDADAALMGEVGLGAARGRRDVVMITLGTGIGTAALVDGRLLGGSRGLIEGGHMIIERGGRPCGCGQRGCWEAYASATSVVARAREALSAVAAAAPAPGQEAGVNASGRSGAQQHEKDGVTSSLSSLDAASLTAKDVFDAARAGDALAGRVVEETAAALGLGCLNLVRLLDPQLLLFAGGMSAAGPQLLLRIQHHFKALGWTVLEHGVEMGLAVLGPDVAGVIGAAEAARRRMMEKGGR